MKPSRTADDAYLNPRPSQSRILAEAARTEQQLRRDCLLAIQQIASGVSHRFNNLLTVALGGVSLLSAGSSDPDSLRNNHQLIADIEAALTQMAYLSNRFNETAVISCRDPEFVNLIVNPIVRDAIQSVPGVPESASAEISFDLRSQRPVLVNGTLLKDAVKALIENAQEAIDASGHIQISTWDREHQVILEVLDDGMGMDIPTQKKCFEPFFSTKGTHSAGLGLTSVQLVSHLHHAELDINSLPNQGTSVRMILSSADPS